MPAIAIVGAGPGLGASLGKVFGGHGLDVALISRRKDRLDVLAPGLADRGITAEGFPAIAPDDLAQTYWNLRARRDHAELVL